VRSSSPLPSSPLLFAKKSKIDKANVLFPENHQNDARCLYSRSFQRTDACRRGVISEIEKADLDGEECGDVNKVRAALCLLIWPASVGCVCGYINVLSLRRCFSPPSFHQTGRVCQTRPGPAHVFFFYRKYHTPYRCVRASFSTKIRTTEKLWCVFALRKSGTTNLQTTAECSFQRFRWGNVWLCLPVTKRLRSAVWECAVPKSREGFRMSEDPRLVSIPEILLLETKNVFLCSQYLILKIDDERDHVSASAMHTSHAS
jgi:hypothetical protein